MNANSAFRCDVRLVIHWFIIAIALAGGLSLFDSASAAPPDAGLVDIAPEAGIAETTRSLDTSVGDYNSDGYPDFLFNRERWLPFRLYRNAGGTFLEDLAVDFGKSNRHDCEWGDPNQDGRPDLYCSLGARLGRDFVPKQLWLQQPDGTFVDEAIVWNVTDPAGRGRQATWINFNGDRYPDLFVGNHFPRVDGVLSPNRLFVNQGGTHFQELEIPGLTAEIGAYCAVGADIDRDGYDDLLVCGAKTAGRYDGMHIYRNVGGAGYEDMALGLGLTGFAYDAIAADVTGLSGPDGVNDLVIVRPGSVRIYRGLGGWKFAAPSVVTWFGAKYAVATDIDGDDDPDVYVSSSNKVGTPNPPDLLLRNLGNGSFTSTLVTASSTIGVGGRVAAIDHDCDGTSSILVVNSDDVGPHTPGPLQLMSDTTTPRLINHLTNGGFECDRAAWLRADRGTITKSEVRVGSKALAFSAPVAFTANPEQWLNGLPTGRYTASVKYKRIGPVKSANLKMEVRDPVTKSISYTAVVSLSRIGVWSQAVIRGVPVNAGQELVFRVGMNLNPGGVLYLDDAKVGKL